jgi:DNA ligase-1
VIRLDREDLFAAPASRRSEALRDVAPSLAVPRIVTADPETAEAFLREALDRGHEGLMAKAPDSLYEAGRRGGSWLKIKAAHTLDLVVLAIEWGHGRRAGKLSNVHLGARDQVSGAFVMLGKTFKGMTDEMLDWQTRRFQELAVATDGHTVHVRPEQVVEVTFNDVQASPHYPAGLALRFARVRRYRHDKTAAEADTIDTVRAIFEAAAPSHGQAQQESASLGAARFGVNAITRRHTPRSAASSQDFRVLDDSLFGHAGALGRAASVTSRRRRGAGRLPGRQAASRKPRSGR